MVWWNQRQVVLVVRETLMTAIYACLCRANLLEHIVNPGRLCCTDDRELRA